MVLQVEHLQKTLGERQIINDVSLQLNPGRVFVLLGPNGAGKTTMVRLILGALKPDHGTVSLFNQTLTTANASALKRQIGVQNDGNLYQTLSVETNLSLWGELFEMTPEMVNQRIEELLVFFDIAQYRTMAISQLSKGTRQKVLLARSRINQPKLLILDEPTTGLDPEAREHLISYLKRLPATGETTIFLCTHQLDGLEQLIDDVAILNYGQIQRAGAVNDLIAELWQEQRVILKAKPLDRAEAVLLTIPEIHDLQRVDEGWQFKATPERLPSLVKQLVANAVSIYAINPLTPTIKDLYFQMIGGTTHASETA